MNHSDRTEMTERIRRITEMESRYDRIRHALRASGACPGCLDSIRDDIRALSGGKTLKPMRPAFCRQT